MSLFIGDFALWLILQRHPGSSVTKANGPPPQCGLWSPFLLKRMLFYYLVSKYVYTCVSVGGHMHRSACIIGGQKRVLDPRRAGVTAALWAAWYGCWYSGRASSTLNHRAIPQVPLSFCVWENLKVPCLLEVVRPREWLWSKWATPKWIWSWVKHWPTGGCHFISAPSDKQNYYPKGRILLLPGSKSVRTAQTRSHS